MAKFIGPLVLSVIYGPENRAELVLGVMGTISLTAMMYATHAHGAARAHAAHMMPHPRM